MINLSAHSEQASEFLAGLYEAPKKRREIPREQMQLERALGVA